MSMYVYGTVTLHESVESESEEGDVGALVTFIDVYPSDVFMVVNVLCNEKSGLENVENVLGGGRCGVSTRVSGVLLNLVEEDVCGLRIVYAADTVG